MPMLSIALVVGRTQHGGIAVLERVPGTLPMVLMKLRQEPFAIRTMFTCTVEENVAYVETFIHSHQNTYILGNTQFVLIKTGVPIKK